MLTTPARADYLVISTGKIEANAEAAALINEAEMMKRRARDLQRASIGAMFGQLLLAHPWLQGFEVDVSPFYQYEGETHYRSVSVTVEGTSLVTGLPVMSTDGTGSDDPGMSESERIDIGEDMLLQELREWAHDLHDAIASRPGGMEQARVRIDRTTLGGDLLTAPISGRAVYERLSAVGAVPAARGLGELARKVGAAVEAGVTGETMGS